MTSVPFDESELDAYRQSEDFLVVEIEEKDNGFIWDCSCGHGIGTKKTEFTTKCLSCGRVLVAGSVSQEDSQESEQASFLEWE